jgi:hypothetical protein
MAEVQSSAKAVTRSCHRLRKRKDVVPQTLKVVSHEFFLVSLCGFVGDALPAGAVNPTSSSSAPDHFPQIQ